MTDRQESRTEAVIERQELLLRAQPTTLRRCLSCEHWMHSTGADHRICNPCKGLVYVRGLAGKRVKA